MPDYYRFFDQVRAVPGKLRAAPAWLRSLPTQMRLWPARFRASVAAGTFPFRQICLGLAALFMVVLAQRVASRQRGGDVKSTAAGNHGATPADLQGRWVTASSGATNYWSHSSGVYQGSGHGLSQIYEFDADGNYKSFVYMEVKTNYSWVKMNNRCQGTVEFHGDHLTLHAASGHYEATGTSYVDRDMTSADLATWSKTYRWRRENGADGKPRLFLDNKDPAKPETTEFRVLTD